MFGKNVHEIETYLLVNDAHDGQHPDAPLDDGHNLRVGRVAQTQPRIVTASDKDVNHGPIAPVENVLQRAIPVAVEHTVEER